VCRGRGRGKGARGVGEITTRWARLFVATFVFPQKGHYPRTRALILFNKIITDLVFPTRVFPGVIYPEISCANVFGLLSFQREQPIRWIGEQPW
jgi:hypothetical protein